MIINISKCVDCGADLKLANECFDFLRRTQIIRNNLYCCVDKYLMFDLFFLYFGKNFYPHIQIIGSSLIIKTDINNFYNLGIFDEVNDELLFKIKKELIFL